MSQLRSRWLPLALLSAGLCGSLNAVDGVVLISQVQALAGNVTPGDAPGFPVTISVPGSYRLSGNLTVPDQNTTAILLNASNVTIDLNGFSIIGPTVCTGYPTVTHCSNVVGASGIGVYGQDYSNVTVFNGSVRGMGAFGVYLLGSGGSVDKVHADANGVTGIYVINGTVTGSTATGNGQRGFDVTVSTVSGNTATGNVYFGIAASCPSTVIGNTAYNNGFNIYTSGANCAVANNAAP